MEIKHCWRFTLSLSLSSRLRPIHPSIHRRKVDQAIPCALVWWFATPGPTTFPSDSLSSPTRSDTYTAIAFPPQFWFFNFSLLRFLSPSLSWASCDVYLAVRLMSCTPGLTLGTNESARPKVHSMCSSIKLMHASSWVVEFSVHDHVCCVHALPAGVWWTRWLMQQIERLLGSHAAVLALHDDSLTIQVPEADSNVRQRGRSC
jgi:hypothetical protein